MLMIRHWSNCEQPILPPVRPVPFL